MKESKANDWTPDDSQRQIIYIESGCHLILAPPGCGKTQILAERIKLALDNGISPEDMLCLTFTNRAARGMRERINERVGESKTAGVFVGNVHRFCSHYLFDNGIVPAESAIIDDDDMTSILARYLNEDEEKVNRDNKRKHAYSQIMFFSHFMFDIEHGTPKQLRMHPECVTREDIAVMKAISETQDRHFDAQMMIDIYNHTDFYLDFVRLPSFNHLLAHEAEQTLLKMRFAHAYTAYKRQNNLIDFEDLLQLTYNSLRHTPDHKRYPWVQVDEVQDLNMLQLEIIKLISGNPTPTPSPSGRGEAIPSSNYLPLKSANPDIYNLLKTYQKENRKKPTEAENAMWDMLKDDALGVRFRRQFAVSDYIVDFICLKYSLAIEIDGIYHKEDEQERYDKQRTEILKSYGINVLRFTNEEVLNTPSVVIDRIKQTLAQLNQSFAQTNRIASPLPEGEGPGVESCLVFLGDEQQAIFSFMGAKLTALNSLKELCKGNIHHLGINHRSPKLMVEMLNTYAISNLASDPNLLPTTASADSQPANGIAAELKICPYPNIYAEFNGVAKRAAELVDKYKQETTAIVVNSNRDADDISKALDHEGHAHFKISGTDIFSTPEVKLLIAHLGVLANDRNFLAWATIMHGLKVCETTASARQFVHQLRARAISPSDFLTLGGTTYLQRFLDIYAIQEIVVFDTETTGLNVFEDDIIQIAAEKIRQGVSVAKFSVYIETERPIPAKLGDIDNPIIEERKNQKIYSHAEALRMFLDFVGDGILLAHNADYDYHIMDYNLRRYLPEVDWRSAHPVCIDSLRLIRLLRPDLKAFKLKTLLAELGLQGENSHLADDDVNATVSLVSYCYKKGLEIKPSQDEYLKRKTTQERIARLQRNYREHYKDGLARLYDRKLSESGVPALVDEMRNFYNWLVDSSWIKQVDKIYYIFQYLADDIIDEAKEPSLKEQLDHHIMELSTFKEADLCGSSTIKDRLFVSTIHKAKGLEFDNVIVFDAVDGRIPNFYHENSPQLLAEDARKLYVAMSRAKHRLFVCYSHQSASAGMPDRKLSRFMEPVKKFF